MSQGAVYFNGGAGAAGPQQFTRRWNTANSTLTENASGYARHVNVTSGSRKLLGYDAVPASHTTIEALTKTRTDTRISGGIYGGAAVRATGAGTAEVGYAAVLMDNGGVASLRLYKFFPAGTAVVLATVAVSWAINEWWWIRLQASGSSLKVRTWKDGNAEPSTWDIGDTGAPITDTDVASGDWAGCYNFGLGNIDHDFFSFGTGGDPAPSYSTAVAETFNSASNAQPVNFRRNWVINASTMNEVSGGYLRMAIATQARNSIFWDAIEPNANIEMVVKWRASAKVTAQPSFQVFLRGSGAAGAENGYRFYLTETSGAELVVAKYTAGTSGTIGTAQAFTWAVDTWYWIRARINGTTLTMTVWADGVAEPSPQRTETDSAFSAAGMNGVVGFVVGNMDVDYAAYAVGGAVAAGPVVLSASQTVAIAQTATMTVGGIAANLSATQTIAIAQTGNLTTTALATRVLSASQTIVVAQQATARSTTFIQPLIGVYYNQVDSGNAASFGYNNVKILDNFLGRTIPLAMDFVGFASLSDWDVGFTTVSNGWKQYNTDNPTKQRRLYISLPLASNTYELSLSKIIAGNFDANLTAKANKLVADGHDNALIRLGWEMNGGWYPWGNTGASGGNATTPAQFRSAWAHVVDLFRAVAGQHFEFVWAPNLDYGQAATDQYYPDKTKVDWIAPDVYGNSYVSTTLTPQDHWNLTLTIAGFGLNYFRDLAIADGKKLGGGECGCGWAPMQPSSQYQGHGIGDMDYFWSKFADWLSTNGPPTGALLGVFDKGPPGTTDYYSRFTNAENWTGTPPTDYYDEKNRCAWAFRHYFGNLSVVSDLSLAGTETNPPTGINFTPVFGFGTGLTVNVPIYTPVGQTIGNLSVTGGERVWGIHAGESDGTSTTAGATGQHGFNVIGGFLGDNPDGSRLVVDSQANRTTALFSPKNMRLGVRNALGGQNINISVATVALAAGSSAGIDHFDDETGIPPADWHRRWELSTTWTGDPAGFLRSTKTVNGRTARHCLACGAQDNVDVVTKMRSSVVAGATTLAGVIARGAGLAGNETCYAAMLITNGGVQQLALRKYLNGAFSDLATFNFTFVANTWYLVRLYVNGVGASVTLRAKVWQDGTTEPTLWSIGDPSAPLTDTTSPINTTGFSGVLAFWGTGGSNIDFDYFAWNATGASPVPSPFASLSANQPIFIGQTASLNNAVAPTIGGIAIGTVGSGIYSGLKLVWGDDFNTEPLPWNLRPAITGNEKGNITGSYGLARSAARSGDSFNWAAFIDESFRGARHESPTDLPNTDTRSVAASVLSMTNSVRNASLDSHLSYVLATGYKDQPDQNLVPKNISAALMSTPSFRFGGDGDFVVEFKFRVPSGTINGCHYGLWTSGDWWPNFGELDVGEGWNATTRQTRSSLHISNSDGTSDVETTIVADTALAVAPRFVQITAVKTGNKIEIFDDIATAGTLVSRGSYTDATRVGIRFRGAQEVKLTLAGETKLSGTGTYNAADWPKSLEVDWVRVWTPVTQGNATPWTELTPAVNTTPGGSWASTFPAAAAIYGFDPTSPSTPGLEEIYSLYDNEDNPGALQREASPIFAPGGMTVDTVARTTAGTVPLTEGGRVGLLFMGTLATGGPAVIAYKLFNVAPAVEKSLFNDCYAAIGESFSRTIAYTDFHSGNLGPHTITVTKQSGGSDFTVTGSGTTSVTIAGTVATAQDSVFKIDCTNVLGQVTTVLRTVKAKSLPFHFHFSRGVYQHNGVNRADFAAAIAAGNATYSMARPANATIYSRDRDGFLTSIGADNTPRISNLGINIEPAQTQLSVGSTAFDGRSYSNMTCVAVTDTDLIIGPSGSKTADRINETATTGSHYVQGRTGTNLPLGAGQAYVASTFVHKGTNRYVQLFGTNSVWPSNEAFVNFDLDRVRATRAGTAVSEYGIEGTPFLGRGWFRIWFKATAEVSATAQVWGLGLIGSDANAAKNPSYLGDTNNFVWLWGSSCVAAPATGPTLQTFVANGQSAATAVTRPADALTVGIPATCTLVRLVFDDGSSQDVTVTGGSTYAVPTNLARGFIREMIGLTALEANLSAYHTIAIVQSGILNTTALTPANLNASQPIGVTQTTFLELGTIPAADIRREISGLNPNALIEMFEYDDRNINGSQVVRWHSGTTIQDQPITWQGKIYLPFPIAADGFQLQLQGTLPRPTLRCSNIGGFLGAYLRTMADGIGAKVTRRRTIAKYMDAVNFPDGNPDADPNAHFPDDLFYVARKSSENAIFVELELAVSYDVIGVNLPRRQVIAGTCLWVYRSPDCGYAGPPVETIDGLPTSDINLDRCRKTLAACKARFGQNNPLNTSAFPASSLIGGG